MKTSEHNPLHCRVCAAEITQATSIYVDEVPSTGSFALCMRCGELSIYEIGPLGTALREATNDELAEFARDYSHVAQQLTTYRARRGLR